MMTVCTFGSPISDTELWQCAHQQFSRHGLVEAVVEANRRIGALDRVGDHAGVDTWMAITLRILYLYWLTATVATRH